MKKKSLICWIREDWNKQIKIYTPTFQSWKGTPRLMFPNISLKKKHKIRSRFDKVKIRITIEEI